MDVTENLVAVAGPKVAVVSDKRGSEGLKGSGNPAVDRELLAAYATKQHLQALLEACQF